MMAFTSIMDSRCLMCTEDAKFALRYGGTVYIEDGKLDIEPQTVECDGYWPWGFHEGKVLKSGECLLVKGGDEYYTILSTPDYDGTFEITTVEFPEPPIAAVYAMVSGGDPGTLYVLMEHHVAVISGNDDDSIRDRDFQSEGENGLSDRDVPSLMAHYIREPGLRNGFED